MWLEHAIEASSSGSARPRAAHRRGFSSSLAAREPSRTRRVVFDASRPSSAMRRRARGVAALIAPRSRSRARVDEIVLSARREVAIGSRGSAARSRHGAPTSRWAWIALACEETCELNARPGVRARRRVRWPPSSSSHARFSRRFTPRSRSSCCAARDRAAGRSRARVRACGVGRSWPPPTPRRDELNIGAVRARSRVAACGACARLERALPDARARRRRRCRAALRSNARDASMFSPRAARVSRAARADGPARSAAPRHAARLLGASPHALAARAGARRDAARRAARAARRAAAARAAARSERLGVRARSCEWTIARAVLHVLAAKASRAARSFAIDRRGACFASTRCSSRAYLVVRSSAAGSQPSRRAPSPSVFVARVRAASSKRRVRPARREARARAQRRGLARSDAGAAVSRGAALCVCERAPHAALPRASPHASRRARAVRATSRRLEPRERSPRAAGRGGRAALSVCARRSARARGVGARAPRLTRRRSAQLASPRQLSHGRRAPRRCAPDSAAERQAVGARARPAARARYSRFAGAARPAACA